MIEGLDGILLELFCAELSTTVVHWYAHMYLSRYYRWMLV